jgi:hypothetical protein
MYWVFKKGPSKEPTLEHENFENKKAKREQLYAVVVAIGVTAEVITLLHSLKESGEVNLQVQSLTSENLVLRSNVALVELKLAETKKIVSELEEETSAMEIGDLGSFVRALKPIAGVGIELRYMADAKAQQTAETLRSAFITRGCPILNSNLIGDIGQKGIVIGYHADPVSEQAARLLMKVLVERGVPALTTQNSKVNDTNTIIVAICQRPNPIEEQITFLGAKAEELSFRDAKLWPRIHELLSKQFVPGSKELADAQQEHDTLRAEVNRIMTERAALYEQESLLRDQLRAKIGGTNAPHGPYIHDLHINIPPLE